MVGRRVSLCVLTVVGALAGAGCHSDGTYQLSWAFEGEGATSALTCARRGVFSIWVGGSSTDGDTEALEVACAPGVLTRSVHTGNWSFTVLGLDREGCYRGNKLGGAGDGGVADGGPAASSPAPAGSCHVTDKLDLLAATAGPVDIAKDGMTMLSVTLMPLPTCADGVDNNGDGRVDLDDPVCQGDPSGSESAPAAAAASGSGQ
jgi:hypothetical protein